MASAIFYICDKKKCEVCYPECKHTSDITHAANFKPAPVLVDGQARMNDAYFEKTLHEFNDDLNKEPYTKRECATCKYEYLSANEAPCYDCNHLTGYNGWEKKEDE